MNLKVSKKKLLEFLPKSVRVPAKQNSLPNKSVKPIATKTKEVSQNRLFFRQVRL